MPGVAPPMTRGESYSGENGSVEKELIMRAPHTHPNSKEYNSKVYYYIEETTRTTSYAASIKTYQNKNNGMDAFLILVSQYAGEDKW